MPPRTRSTPRTRISPGLGELTPVPVPAQTAQLPGEHKAFDAACGCFVIVGHEPVGRAPGGIWLPERQRMLWHLSISHPDRLPSWDEIADARYALVPEDVTMALLLPPPDEYVNLSKTTMQLWQIDDRRAD